MGELYRMTNTIPNQLTLSIKNLYNPAGFKVTKEPYLEKESAEYGAARFGLNNHDIVFRVAKTTEDRPGQFVTLWKRSPKTHLIEPIDVADGVDFVVVSTFGQAEGPHKLYGQFIFPKNLLIKKGIMSDQGKSGKLAIRVFPPWSEKLANEGIIKTKQLSIRLRPTQQMSDGAKKTQEWQLKYFLNLKHDYNCDSTLKLATLLQGI